MKHTVPKYRNLGAGKIASRRGKPGSPNRHIIHVHVVRAIDHRGRLRRRRRQLEYHATKGWRSYAA